MGFPSRCVRPEGNPARASSKAMKIASAKRPTIRLVRPGSAFCSWMAMGMRKSHAASTTGPLA